MRYLATFCVLFGSMLGCDAKPKHHFIVPVGYRGIFMVVEDESSEKMPIDGDDRFVYEIPSTGVLAIKNTGIFSEWTESITAEFSDGTILPTPVQAELLPPDDEIGLHVLSGDSQRNYYFLVGTNKQLSEWFKNRTYQVSGMPDRSD